jgi:cytoskeletal protein CcmA (bactofilin family)
MDSNAEKRTLVEDGTQFKGSLTSTCPIVVKGRIDGEVDAPSLVVSASGAVHGRARVGEVRSQGELSGEFDADTVQLSGTVKDNTVIRAKSIEVKLSPANGKMQVIFGECLLDVGEAPTKAEEIPRGDVAKRASVPSAAEALVEPRANGGGTIPPVR